MIPFKNQDKLISDLTNELLTLDYPKSWNIVVPPCFYAGTFASALCERLRRDIPAARVALIAADAVFSPIDLIKQIYYKWTGKIPDHIEPDSSPDIMLEEVLKAIGDGRNILIIREFHKILGKMDERILVALRSAEQAGRINTIAIAIYPHKWLRDKWKKEGHLLHVSNYGDHCGLRVEPYSEIDVKRLLCKQGVPAALATMLYEWTGGFPKCLDSTLEAWIVAGRPDLNPRTTALLQHVASESLERFAKCIDSEGSTRFSQLVINLHQHINEAESYEQLLRFHPWAHIILDNDGLRADTLGDALTQAQMEEAFHAGKITESLSAVADIAIRNYRLGQYDLSIQAIKHFRETYNSPRLHLIELHSIIMVCLRGGVSASPCPDTDTEWTTLMRAIVEARTELPKVLNKKEDEFHRELIFERYREIEKLAIIASKACNEGVRYLDCIGGLRGDEAKRDSAFALAVFQCESGRSIRGNSAACKAVIELPEQIMRLWGFWKYDINYYSYSDTNPEIWAKVQEVWPSNLLQPTTPSKGQKFSSLYLFCYYLYALELCTNIKVPTWQTQENIQQELSMLDTRNDISHATVHINAKTRKKLFDFIDTWLDRLERDCMGSTNRDSVMSKVEPLEVF